MVYNPVFYVPILSKGNTEPQVTQVFRFVDLGAGARPANTPAERLDAQLEAIRKEIYGA
jgi:hypothetical protein